jgi:hypothetical protein
MNVAGCRGKVATYHSFAQAERSAKSLRRRREGNAAPYRCRECHHYHLGTSVGGQNRVARDRRLKIQRLREREAWT